MTNNEEELLVMLDAMAKIISKVEDLPEDCPAVKESELYKEIDGEIKELVTYMKTWTAEMDRQMDESSLRNAFKFNFGNKNEDN
jgi:hypothetical protein